MYSLKKVTAEFIETEDRIRLSALSDDDKTVAFWLTQRLLSRLITHLAKWLEKNPPDLQKASSGQNNPDPGFIEPEKKSDRAPFPEQTSVKIKKSDESVLITEVDVKFGENGLVLILKSEKKSCAKISFTGTEARQWINILLNLWQKGGWPSSLLPQWIKNNSIEETSTNTIH